MAARNFSTLTLALVRYSLAYPAMINSAERFNDLVQLYPHIGELIDEAVKSVPAYPKEFRSLKERLLLFQFLEPHLTEEDRGHILVNHELSLNSLQKALDSQQKAVKDDFDGAQSSGWLPKIVRLFTLRTDTDSSTDSESTRKLFKQRKETVANTDDNTFFASLENLQEQEPQLCAQVSKVRELAQQHLKQFIDKTTVTVVPRVFDVQQDAIRRQISREAAADLEQQKRDAGLAFIQALENARGVD